MFQIGDKIVSSEILEEEFHCHLERCYGNCCVHGDSGAPLQEGETRYLEKYYPSIKNYLSPAGVRSIEEQGTWIDDSDGDRVTPLIEGRECAYTYFNNGIAFCGIEKTWEMGEIPFRKPLSCHLYPIRISKIGQFTALNYHRWPICDPARNMGRRMGIPVFRFLKDALIRAFGETFYGELEKVYAEWKKK